MEAKDGGDVEMTRETTNEERDNHKEDMILIHLPENVSRRVPERVPPFRVTKLDELHGAVLLEHPREIPRSAVDFCNHTRLRKT